MCFSRAGHVARTGIIRNVYKMLVGKPEWKRKLGRYRRRWNNNISIHVTEIGSEDADRIHLAQDRD